MEALERGGHDQRRRNFPELVVLVVSAHKTVAGISTQSISVTKSQLTEDKPIFWLIA